MKIIYAILATLLGFGAYRQFDFEHLRFKHVGLGVLFLLACAFSVVGLVRANKSGKRAAE